MNLFGAGANSAVDNARRASDRADRQMQARADDARAAGKNPVRVADVRQRHSTNSGRGGRVIASLF